jgi:hypothetical protein
MVSEGRGFSRAEEMQKVLGLQPLRVAGCQTLKGRPPGAKAPFAEQLGGTAEAVPFRKPIFQTMRAASSCWLEISPTPDY